MVHDYVLNFNFCHCSINGISLMYMYYGMQTATVSMKFNYYTYFNKH